MKYTDIISYVVVRYVVFFLPSYCLLLLFSFLFAFLMSWVIWLVDLFFNSWVQRPIRSEHKSPLWRTLLLHCNNRWWNKNKSMCLIVHCLRISFWCVLWNQCNFIVIEISMFAISKTTKQYLQCEHFISLHFRTHLSFSNNWFDWTEIWLFERSAKDEPRPWSERGVSQGSA